jgi:photosystem II stability/assembly factor-like uncharacterized protein
MRTVTLFFMLAVAVSVCDAQWFPQNSGTSKTLRAVSFMDINTGTAVGDSGIVLRTTNGGTDWSRRSPVPQGTDLYGVSFSSANTGTAIGDWGICRTTNEGLDWTRVYTSSRGCMVFDVSFGDTNNGIAVGLENATQWVAMGLRTTNGGAHWLPISISAFWVGYRGVSFIDGSTGLVVGDGIALTTDGGTTWFQQVDTTIVWGLNDVSLVNANLCVAVGDSGRILRTTNGGASWDSQTSGTSSNLYGVHFADSLRVTIVGAGGLILRSTNAAATWTTQQSGTTTTLRGVCFVGANNGWAVEDSGAILHTTNGGLTFVGGEPSSKVPTEFSLEQNYPNPFNPSTNFRYALPHTSFVTLTVYNTLGQQVARLVNEQQQAGYHDIVFRGDGLASSVYFYRIQAGDFVRTRKLVLLR